VRQILSIGFRAYDILPGTPVQFENQDGASRCVFIWQGDGDDDPSVVITCKLWGVEYVHRPILVTYAFPVGELITVQSDARLRLQTWTFPIGFCSPATHFYSAATFLTDEFTLAENITNGGLCFFFDNPSTTNHVIVQIMSKRVDYTESRVEVWNSDFERVQCGKARCDLKLHERFFVRVVGAKEGIRYYMEAHFEQHDTPGGCGRNAIPVWDGKLLYTAALKAVDEEFMCDDPSRINRRREIQFWILTGALAIVIMAAVAWLWRQSDETGGWIRVPKQLLEQSFASGARLGSPQEALKSATLEESERSVI
jgi:hypothetical protein